MKRNTEKIIILFNQNGFDDAFYFITILECDNKSGSANYMAETNTSNDKGENSLSYG